MKKPLKSLIFFGLFFFVHNNYALANEFDAYKNDAKMICWNNNSESTWTLKGDVIRWYTVDDVSTYKIGQDAKQNGDKLEFIVNATIFKIYLNFEEKTGSFAGMPFECI